jgi:hypothetical protein
LVNATPVIAGLDPAIHPPSQESFEEGWMRGSSPRMTPRMGTTAMMHRNAGKIAHCRKPAAMWSKSEGWMGSLNFRRAGDIRARFNAKQGTADERHDI